MQDLLERLRDIQLPPDLAELNRTDLGNAKRLVAMHGEDIRFCPQLGWLVWSGRNWVRDDTGEIMRLAKDVVRATYLAALGLDDAKRRKELAEWALRSEARSRIEAMVRLAESEPGVPVPVSELDRDPFLLNVENGTLDLRTAELRPHRREDMLTRLCPVPYDPRARAPTWEAFLHRIMSGNQRLIGFLQRAAGYCLTGDVSEQVLFLCYGTGANGKSVFLRTLLNMAGPYGKPTDPELLLARRGEAHPTSIADLAGVRLAVAIETEAGRRLAEVLVKWLTGGDKLKARFMRQDFFEFEPTHKLWLATNHKPVVKGTDNAIWRRIRLIPFSVTIPPEEQDRHLLDKLSAELPGILAWAVKGALEWQEKGLDAPPEVLEATEAYRSEMDVLGDFLAERCVTGPGVKATAAQLYKAYLSWCEENGEKPVSQRAFGLRLSERGFERKRGTGNQHMWVGIALREGSAAMGHYGSAIGHDPKPASEAQSGARVTQGTQSSLFASRGENEIPRQPGERVTWVTKVTGDEEDDDDDPPWPPDE